MEKIVTLKIWPFALRLETEAGSILMVFPGGAIIKIGFLDSAGEVGEKFSHRLYYRAGVVYHELKYVDGTVQQIPVGRADNTPELYAWLKQADLFIP